MRWLSVDPATKTGIARWEDETLVSVATMRPPAPKEAKARGVTKASGLVVASAQGADIYLGRKHAWAAQLTGVEAVVVEEAMGFMPKSVAQLAFRRGYIAALCESRGIAYIEVNTREWRRVAGERFGVNFPTKSEDAKRLAIDLVREHYGTECSDDEADAVLVGLWAIRTRALLLRAPADVREQQAGRDLEIRFPKGAA
jgi:hypothetical protein